MFDNNMLVKLFIKPKINNVTDLSTKDEIEDFIDSYGTLYSSDYILADSKIFSIQNLLRMGIKCSTKGFQWLYVSNNEILIEYIKNITLDLDLSDEYEINLGGLENVSICIEDGICYLWIDNNKYIITYEQYKKLLSLSDIQFDKNKLLDKSENTAICPYCGYNINSYIHQHICEKLREV